MANISFTDRPIPVVSNVLGILIAISVGLYSAVTIFYVTPSNPLRIHFDTELGWFQKCCYQKWGFFAPPPEHNDRLYFAFTQKSGEGVTIEVLEGIWARKRHCHPFNTDSELVDYSVTTAARQIADSIREVYRYRKVHELFSGDPFYLDDLAAMQIEPESEYGGQIRVLLRYAAFIASQQNLELDGLRCQIALTSIPIRPFIFRHNREFQTKERLLYRTSHIDVPHLAPEL